MLFFCETLTRKVIYSGVLLTLLCGTRKLHWESVFMLNCCLFLVILMLSCVWLSCSLWIF